MAKASLTLFMQSNNFILHFSFDNLLISKKNCVTVEHKLGFSEISHALNDFKNANLRRI